MLLIQKISKKNGLFKVYLFIHIIKGINGNFNINKCVVDKIKKFTLNGHRT